MKIISFEGIEGVGKSTQIKMLDAYLKKNGFSTEVLREPGSTIVGEKIRDILLNSNDELSSEAELLLMFSARAQLIKEKIIGNKPSESINEAKIENMNLPESLAKAYQISSKENPELQIGLLEYKQAKLDVIIAKSEFKQYLSFKP